MPPNWMIVQDDHYPIGSNGLWHGGIHIIPKISLPKSDQWIKPLFSGAVVAGKIQEADYTGNYGGENKYSTSYVLLEHTMKLKLDDQPEFGIDNQSFEFSFFSLYMHLLPFKNYTDKYIEYLDLPFYLSWKTVTIRTENNELPEIKKIMAGDFPLYHGSSIEADEPEWFHPNNHINNKNTIRVKIKNIKDNDDSFTKKSISKNYIKLPQLPKGFKIKPKDPDIPVPIYDFDSAIDIYCIGKIKGTATINENTNNVMQIITLGTQPEDKPIDVPEGVIFEAFNDKIALQKEVSLYEVQKNEKVEAFALFKPDDYLRQFREKCEQLVLSIGPGASLTSEIKNQINQLCNAEASKISRLHRINKIYIVVGYNEKRAIPLLNTEYQPLNKNQRPTMPILTTAPPLNKRSNEPEIFYVDPDYSRGPLPNDFYVIVKRNGYINGYVYRSPMNGLKGDEQLQSYHVRKKTMLKEGLKLQQKGSSELPGRKKYTILFNTATKPIYADITKFAATKALICTVNASQSDISERGISCIDNSGYIRNLLYYNESFRPTSGTMKEGQRIDIDTISSYKNKLSRHIFYEDGILFYGVSDVNNNIETKVPGETSICKIKKGTKVYTSDNIGRPGTFIGPDNLCHLGVFIKDTGKINELFRKRHILNIYNLKRENVYKKVKSNIELLDIETIEYKHLQEGDELPEGHTVVEYELQEAEDGVYLSFKYKEKEYFIQTSDKDNMAENLLDFNQNFIQSKDDDDDIFCDDTTIQDYKTKNKHELKKFVCHFPFEWDAKLYAMCEDTTCDECTKAYQGKCEKLPQKLVQRKYGISSFPELSKIMKNADIRNDVDFMKNESKVWHFHPDTFYDQYNRLLQTQSINPYKDKYTTVNLEEFVCKNSPGFAPLWRSRPGDTDDPRKHLDNAGNSYALITAEFNRDMGNYYHEGVDFRGAKETEIISFIFGRVIYAGWTNTIYGIVLIVADERENGIYMLAHLEDIAKDIQEGSSIKPYEVVAYVGASGYDGRKDKDYWNKIPGSASHLHVSYYSVDYNEEDSNKGKYGIFNRTTGLWSFNGVIGFNKETEYDPFNHEIKRWKKRI